MVNGWHTVIQSQGRKQPTTMAAHITNTRTFPCATHHRIHNVEDLYEQHQHGIDRPNTAWKKGCANEMTNKAEKMTMELCAAHV